MHRMPAGSMMSSASLGRTDGAEYVLHAMYNKCFDKALEGATMRKCCAGPVIGALGSAHHMNGPWPHILPSGELPTRCGIETRSSWRIDSAHARQNGLSPSPTASARLAPKS